MRRESGAPTRVLIVDDHELAREGLRSMVEREPDLLVVGEAANGQHALRLYARTTPDVVLMDMRMPEMNGVAATRAIRERWPDARVLIVSMHEDAEYVLEALDAGAAGYVLKDATRAELIGAIRRVLREGTCVEADLSGRILRQLARQRGAQPEPGPERLTAREHEVLQHLAAGLSNPEIAERLVIGRGTVKGYVENIIRKLGAADRTQAVVRAIQLGLLDIPAAPRP